jgi:hypothetical protein
MAKYRITTIPDNLPIAQDGGSFWKKKYNVAKSKKLKRKTDTPKKSAGSFSNEVEEDEVTTVNPQNQPMMEVQNVEQPSYWNNMLSDAEQGKECPPGLYDYEGTGECVTEEEYVKRIEARTEESQRKFDDDTAMRKQKFEERSQEIQENRKEERKRRFAEDVKNYDEHVKTANKNDKIKPWQSYPTSTGDRMIDVLDENGEPIIDPETGKPQQQRFIDKFANGFLINKNDRGYYDIYPKNVVEDRILKSGFTEEQFKNTWGLDPKQVKEQMGDLIDAAGQRYDETMQNYILKTAIDKNMSVEDVIKSMPKSWGTQKGLTSKFKNSSQKILDDSFTDMQNALLSSMEYDEDIAKKDEDVFYSNDPKKAWENKYHSNDLKYLSDKTRRGIKAQSDYMNTFGKVGQDTGYESRQGRFDDQMAQQRAANRNIQKIITSSKSEDARQGAQDKEFNEAFGKYLSNAGIPIQKDLYERALAKVANDPKAKLKFLKDIKSNPQQAVGDLLKMTADSSGKTYEDLYSDLIESNYTGSVKARQNTFKEGSYKPELTISDKIGDYLRHPFDAAFYALNPRLDMHGNWNIGYDERLKLEKEKGVNLDTMDNAQGVNPMSVLNWTPLQALNPFKIGSNLKHGYQKGDFINALGDEIVDIGTSVGGVKGLNAVTKGSNLYDAGKTVLNRVFNPVTDVGYAIKAGQNLDNATEEFNKGNYYNAAIEGGIGLLDASALYRLRKLGRLTDGFNNFNSTYPLTTTNRFQPTNNNLLGYKNGGSLPKAQLGKIVNALKSLKPGTTSKIVKPLVSAEEINKLAPLIKANMPGMQARLQAAKSLKDLDYVGPEFSGMDMYRAAKSDESMDKLMQLAIDHDRTGYRQVSGQIIPKGTNLGGYGNRSYDMTKQHFGRPMSQLDHMRLSGVDFTDPVSVAAYQASTIPFEQYGYRAGIDDVHRGDALYMASLPEKQKYGPYQFKITMPTDYSTGNWSTWYDKNILGKKPYRMENNTAFISGSRATPEQGEVLFDLGMSKGVTKPLFGDNNILTGSGLQTRRWIGNYGTEVGKVDPNFKFTNLMNMSTSDYKEMENLRNSIIKGYNTGWRGQYKKGGMVMKLSKSEIDKYVKEGYVIEEE